MNVSRTVLFVLFLAMIGPASALFIFWLPDRYQHLGWFVAFSTVLGLVLIMWEWRNAR